MINIYTERKKTLHISKLESSLEFNLISFYEDIIPIENVKFIKVHIYFFDYADVPLRKYFFIKENVNKISSHACITKILARLKIFYTWVNISKIKTFTLYITYTT